MLRRVHQLVSKRPECCAAHAAAYLCLVVATTVAGSAVAETPYRVVALTGTTGVPGAGGVFTAFGMPTIEDGGWIAFAGEYATGSGVFVASPAGVVSDIARTDGDLAPGTTSQFFGFMEVGTIVLINDDASVAFLTSYDDGQELHKGIWSNHTGALTDVVRTRATEAPGSGGRTFIEIASPIGFGVHGVAFIGTIQLADDPSTRGGGVYTATGVALSKLVQTGEVAPGALAPFTQFTTLTSAPDWISFYGLYDLGGGEIGIFRYGAIGEDLARTDTGLAPGTTSPFSDLGRIDMNGDGTVVLRGEYADGAEQGIFLYRNDLLSDLVRTDGAPIPGTEWQPHSFSRPRVDSLGHVAFFTGFSDENGVNHSGIVSDASGQLALVARRLAEPAPGSSEPFSGYLYSPGFAMNGRGQIAFVGMVGGQRGIWATHGPGKDLVAVAQHGQSWDLDGLPGGESRTVDTVELAVESGGEDSLARSFNDAGELSFRLEFTAASGGGEGLYVATVPYFDTPQAAYGYSVGTGSVPTLYRFSPLSGASYPAVKLSLPSGYATPLDIEGLCFDGAGLLWAIDCENDILITIHPTSGRVTVVGALAVDSDDVGLSFGPGGALFMADAGTGTLYTLDQGTGLASPVGALGAPIDSLAWHATRATMYGIAENTTELFTIDPTTGAATSLSSLPALPQTNNTGLTVDGGGVLWAMYEDIDPAGEHTVVFTIDDPLTGATTERGSITDPDPLAGQFESFAMSPTNGGLFADGFESGDTSYWSATMP